MLSASTLNIQHIPYEHEHWAYIRRDNYYLVGFAVVFGYLKKCLISFSVQFFRGTYYLRVDEARKKNDDAFIYGSASQFWFIFNEISSLKLEILSWNGPFPWAYHLFQNQHTNSQNANVVMSIFFEIETISCLFLDPTLFWMEFLKRCGHFTFIWKRMKKCTKIKINHSNERQNVLTNFRQCKRGTKQQRSQEMKQIRRKLSSHHF